MWNNMRQKGKLFVISGPSGAGKGSINTAVIRERKDTFFSVSATSRKPRAGEVDGVNYHFLTRDDFEKMIREDAFIEWAEVYGNYYGTIKEEVFHNLDCGKNVILEIDIQGALQIKEKYEAVFVFILPPSMEELRKRVVLRGSETEESLQRRMREALEEIKYIQKYDYYIINTILEESIRKLHAIIEAENSRINYDIVQLLDNEDNVYDRK